MQKPLHIVSATPHGTRRWWHSFFLVATLGLSCLIFNTQAVGQTFAAGYGWYTKGNFAKAEAGFSQALRSARGVAEQGRIYKYMGISQYMQRKSGPAAQSFKRALQLQPQTAIAKSEVLDEGVITFFNQQRSAAPRAAAPAPARGGVAMGTGKAVLKTTYLRVTCNVKSATILLDGILAGNAGDLIEVKAGVAEIQLNAPGYLSKKARIQIVANRQNDVTLQLAKPQPKPKPKPAPAVARKSAPQRKQQNDFLPDPGTGGLFDDSTAASTAPSMGGRDLQSEFALDANTGGAYAQPAPQMQPQYMPQPQAYPAYPQQPMMPYPQPQMYAPPMYPTQPYAPAYPAPYAQPYAAPYQAAPYQAAPQYQPPPVSQPYGPAMPPPITGGGAGGPVAAPGGNDPGYYQDSSESFLPPVKKSKSSKPKSSKLPAYRPSHSPKRKSSTSSGSSKSNILITILPFGAGQFQNKSYIMGSLFAAAELGALGWAFKSKMEGDQLYADAVAYLQENPNDADYRTQADAAIQEKRNQQNMATYAFVGLWVAGVGEAIYNEPKPKAKAKSSSRKRRADLDLPIYTRYALLDSDVTDAAADEEQAEEVDDSLVARLPQQPVTIDLRLMPSPADADRKPGVGVGVVAGWKF